ncbi:MAG: hypothetical protein ACP59X_18700 [Solidesulfovibrio sp. DCME]|uniref:hypothetical protein n=1 Tax=Solidesulfovibrio sp. DCME TaxID=3447380 RepID=UPI003D0E2E61
MSTRKLLELFENVYLTVLELSRNILELLRTGESPFLKWRLSWRPTSPLRLVEQPALGKFLGLVFIKVEMPGDSRAIIAIGSYCEDGQHGDEAHGKADKNPFHDPQ